ncbi:ATP-dependent RNA helicase dbp7 [Allomyces javanicus]|nr:ATP-dependent RNA helicase dbp7 [Allomyces javanicus]
MNPFQPAGDDDYDFDGFFGHAAAAAAPKSTPAPPPAPAAARDPAAPTTTKPTPAAAKRTKNASDNPVAAAAAKPAKRAAKPTTSATDSPSTIAIPDATPTLDDSPTFTDLGVPTVLAAHLRTRLEITEPTRVQTAVLRALQQHPGRDLAIQSETGSGKTLSFVLPILQALLFSDADDAKLSRAIGPVALILAPTRELALQIHGVVEAVANMSARSTTEDGADDDAENGHVEKPTPAPGMRVPRHWLVSSVIVGGEKKKAEKARLRKGVNILVSTPGRFLDHLRTTRCLDVSCIRWIVLDEADRLLDLGFERDLKAIFAHLHGRGEASNPTTTPPRALPPAPSTAWPARRQVFLCSATIDKVAHLAQWVLTDPVRVSGTKSKGPAQLVHEYVEVPVKLKFLALATTLLAMARNLAHGGTPAPRKAIIFFSTRAAVDFYHLAVAHLFSADLAVHKLHGSMDANERKSTMAEFNAKSSATTRHVLITTDVAARGLDLAGVDLIVQYDAPADVAEYVHRVGRTARAGRKGAAVLFLAPHEVEFATTVLADDGMKKVDLTDRAARALKVTPDTWEKAAVRKWGMPLEDWVWRDKHAKRLATEGFQGYVKGYATYPAALKSIFHVRKLHLGHLAKSFGLRDAPAQLAQIMGGQRQQQGGGGAAAEGTSRKAKRAKADADEGGDEQPGTKRVKKVHADGIESYAKGADETVHRHLAAEFDSGAGYALGGKKKGKGKGGRK